MTSVGVINGWVRAASLAAATLAIGSDASAAMCVNVNLRFTDRKPDSALVDTMKGEAATIWSPYGLQIQWATAPGAGDCTAVQGSFDVFIDHTGRPRLTTTKSTLGSTQVASGAIDAVPIYIDQQATEEVLGSMTSDRLMRLLGRPFTTPSDTGRALGRVLAHEIGHVILAARLHQAHGLMRRMFHAPDLIALQRDSFDLSEAEVVRLREREIELQPGYHS